MAMPPVFSGHDDWGARSCLSRLAHLAFFIVVVPKFHCPRGSSPDFINKIYIYAKTVR